MDAGGSPSSMQFRGDGRNPRWNPDNSKIVFNYYTDPDNPSIGTSVYIMNSDGSARERLTQGSIADMSAAGDIVFEYAGDLNVMNYGTREIQLLLEDAYCPEWSPDGTRIAFLSMRSGNQNVWVLDYTVTKNLNVPYYYQGTTEWCGPTSLSMLLKYYGKNKHNFEIADDINVGRSDDGVQFTEIKKYIEEYYPEFSVKLRAYVFKTQMFEDIKGYIDNDVPCILGLAKQVGINKILFHMVVMTGYIGDSVIINDPSGAALEWLETYPTDVLSNVAVKWEDIKIFVPPVLKYSLLVLENQQPDHNTYGTIHLVDADITFNDKKGGILSLYLDKGIDWNSDGKHKGKIDSSNDLIINIELYNHLSSSEKYFTLVMLIDETGNFLYSHITQPFSIPGNGKDYLIHYTNLDIVQKGVKYYLVLRLWNLDHNFVVPSDEIIIELPKTK